MILTESTLSYSIIYSWFFFFFSFSIFTWQRDITSWLCIDTFNTYQFHLFGSVYLWFNNFSGLSITSMRLIAFLLGKYCHFYCFKLLILNLAWYDFYFWGFLLWTEILTATWFSIGKLNVLQVPFIIIITLLHASLSFN